MLQMFMKNMKKNKKGFTLTELIVVVAILGVLAAVATPIVRNQVANARTSANAANARAIVNALRLAEAENVGITWSGIGADVSISNAVRRSLNPIPQFQNDTGNPVHFHVHYTAPIDNGAASIIVVNNTALGGVQLTDDDE